MSKRKLGSVFLVICLTGGVARADEGPSCSMWGTIVSRSLFNNSGTFATKGPALIAIPECSDQTGLYGSLFLSVPLRTFSVGKEIDVRLGKRFELGGFSWDVSIADYYFGIGAHHMYNTIDGRVKVSRPFTIGTDNTIRPYVIGDYQRSLDLRNSASAVAIGATADTKIMKLPGQPTLAGEVSIWYYPTTFAPNKGPVRDLDLSLSYQVNKGVSVGPRARWTWGDVSAPGDRHPKSMIGAFFSTVF